MAYKITDFTGFVVAPAGDYPYGDVKDNPSGTLANRVMFDDIFQFFQKAMDLAGITPNSLPDNLSNGYQFADAVLGYPAIAAMHSGTLSGQTFTLTANQAYVFDTLSTGSFSFALNFTNARPGVEINIQSTVSSATAFNVTATSGSLNDFVPTGAIANLSGAILLYIRIKYLGSAGTVHYISQESFAL